MKQYINHIVFYALLALLTLSCERAIVYDGPQTEPKLAVSAAAVLTDDSVFVNVYVGHSVFFLDKEALMNDVSVENGRRNYLNDALVQIKIDNADWQTINRIDTVAGRYALRLKSTPHDSVALKIYHKDYGETYAVQKVHPKVSAKVESIMLSDEKIKVKLHIDNYSGAENEVIQLSAAAPAYALYTRERYSYTYDEQTSLYSAVDSVKWVLQPRSNNTIYSDDYIFNEMNKASNNHYQAVALLLSAEQIASGATVQFDLDMSKITNPTDKISIYLSAIDFDAYLYNKSVNRNYVATGLTSLSNVDYSETDDSYYASKWYVFHDDEIYDGLTMPSTEDSALVDILALGYDTINYKYYNSEDMYDNIGFDPDMLADFDLEEILSEAFEDIGLAEKRQVYSCFSDGAIGGYVLSNQTVIEVPYSQLNINSKTK